MDKKKVIELIGNVEKYLLAYEKSGKNADIAMAFQQLHEAQDEVQKSDWISVEDELPPIGETVLAVDKDNVDFMRLTHREPKANENRHWKLDKNGFPFPDWRVTHWRKIDKLDKIK